MENIESNKTVVWYKKGIFRWIAVIPGSFLAGVASLFPLHWILYGTLNGQTTLVGMDADGQALLELIEPFLTPIVLMMVVILTSYKIAPKHKFFTSVVLAILWLVLLAVGTIYLLGRIGFDIRTFFTLIGILMALYINWKKSKDGLLKIT